MAEFAKAALNTWCSRKKLQIKYEVSDVSKYNEEAANFYCSVSIESINFVSAGNGQSKKIASNKSALSMLVWLVKNNYIGNDELGNHCYTLLKINEVLFPHGQLISMPGFTGYQVEDETNSKNASTNLNSTTKSSSDNATPSIKTNSTVSKTLLPMGPGNFTLDNAKRYLHQFMQKHNIKADYEYDSSGPAHKRMFTAKISIFVKRLGSEMTVTESGESKSEASRLCALKFCQQLLSMGLIEEVNPSAPSKRQLIKNNVIYEFLTLPTLKEQMIATSAMIQSSNQLTNLDLSKAIYPTALNLENPFALKFVTSEKLSSNLFYNPWTNTKYDDPVFTGLCFEEVNQHLKEQFHNMINDSKFQSILKTRMKLPIFCIKEQVIDVIDKNSVLIIRGATGCDKSTQVPQFILDTYLKQGKGAHCNIVVTQPHPISTISTCERVAFERTEMLSADKSSVGYSVRFDHLYPRPYGSVLFCTTNHLLRRIHLGLKGISHLIIDKVHERDTNTDLLLVIVREMIKLGHNIKVIIMSATVDAHSLQNLQEYFNNCCVLEVDRTLFPVERYFLEDTIEMIKWCPSQLTYVEDDKDAWAANLDNIENKIRVLQKTELIARLGDSGTKYSSRTLELLRQLSEGAICFELIVSILEYIETLKLTGAVLIFLPGWAAIFELLYFLKSHKVFGDQSRFLLLPLHSQLAYKDNQRVFEKVSQRKIILSTNIAETSVTIDDVVFVIDTCLEKHVYCNKTNLSSYIVDWVTKSNIQQRQDCAGRVHPGYFFVLCLKQRFEKFEEYKTPELLVTSLVEPCLLIKYLGFGNVTDFFNRCIDQPSSEAVEKALAHLRHINALDEDNRLTSLGTVLVKLPLDPSLGRMVLLAFLFGLGGPALTIAAASATAHHLIDHSNNRLAASQAIKKLDEDRRISDHLNIYRLISTFERQASRADDVDFFDVVNGNSLIQAQNARNSLCNTLIRLGFSVEAFQSKSTYSVEELDTLTGLLVTGFFPNICLYLDKRLIRTSEKKVGIISKDTVLCAYVQEGFVKSAIALPSPLFVYTEKSVMQGLISTKQMTMISHMHLLLHGIHRYELIPMLADALPEEVHTVLLDEWLDVLINPQILDCTWIIKTELKNILMKICHQPATLGTLAPIELKVLDTVRSMCLMNNSQIKYHSRKN